MAFEIRGEYWIQDGHVEFADMDTGDIGHEGIAIQHVAYGVKDSIVNAAENYEIETDDVDKYGEVDHEKLEEILSEVLDHIENEQQISISQAKQYFCKEYDCDPELLNAFNGGDPSLYCMKHEGWIAIREQNAELYGWNEQARKNLLSGLHDIMDDNGDEEEEDEEFEIYIYDHKTKKHMNFTMEELERPLGFKMDVPAATKYNKKSFFHQYAPRDTEENKYSKQIPSNPNKFNVAAQKTNMIGPGQNAWRGTSESVKNNFKDHMNKNDKFKK